MAKSHLHPYMRPLIKAYSTTAFLKESKIILNFLRNSSLKSLKTKEDKFWIHIQGAPSSKKTSAHWMPKIYLCPQPKEFWPAVAKLIEVSRLEKLSWKFSKDLKLFARPDKIVLYAKDFKDLKRILKVLSQVVQNKSFHKLAFAATPQNYGIKHKSPGTFIGADPIFMKKMSWRLYRWTIQESLILPNLKNGRLDKDTLNALPILNVTTKHNGPLKFQTSKDQQKFIKEFWKEVSS